jgi:hypothetical protein
MIRVSEAAYHNLGGGRQSTRQRPICVWHSHTQPDSRVRGCALEDDPEDRIVIRPGVVKYFTALQDANEEDCQRQWPNVEGELSAHMPHQVFTAWSVWTRNTVGLART